MRSTLPFLILVAFLAASASSAKAATGHPLREKVAGTWYEIARLPERIGRDCHNTQVVIRPQDDGSFEAVSSCRKGAYDGPEKRHRARAWLIGQAENLSVKVVYKLIFRAQFSVLELDDEAEYVVIGSRDGKHLSIASRDKSIPQEIWSELMQRLEDRGVPVDRLIRVPHN